jgi:hypothetical protein
MRLLVPRREPFPRSLPFRIGLPVVVGLLLVGCGKHYWSKPGAGASDFNRESNECARENAVQVSSSKDYGIVRHRRRSRKRQPWRRRSPAHAVAHEGVPRVVKHQDGRARGLCGRPRSSSRP